MKYPAIPKTLAMPGGEVVIVFRAALKHPDGSECWGLWDISTRTIELLATAPKRHQWRVLFHELAHAALDDSGLSQGMTEAMEESLCEAIASARMREKFG